MPEWFYDTDDSGGGGDTQPPATVVPPAGGDTAGGSQPPSDRIVMTPAQLAERLARAKDGAKLDAVKALGYDSLEAMQEAVNAGKAALEAQKTDAQRQAEALKQAADRLAQLETEAAQTRQQRDSILIRSAAIEKMAGKFIDPGAAFRLLDSGKISLDGETVKGLDEAIEELAKQYPWTLANTNGRKELSAPKIGATNPDGQQATPKENDDERRSRFFGSGGSTPFFQGSGVRAGATSNRPK